MAKFHYVLKPSNLAFNVFVKDSTISVPSRLVNWQARCSNLKWQRRKYPPENILHTESFWLFTSSMVVKCRRTRSSLTTAWFTSSPTMPVKSINQSCRFILGALFQLTKNPFHSILRDGEYHVHLISCAFTVFNGINFGNLDTFYNNLNAN